MYDIIVIAGQSNAEGNGIKKDNSEVLSSDVFHLVDKNSIGPKVLEDKKVIIDMVYPTNLKK